MLTKNTLAIPGPSTHEPRRDLVETLIELGADPAATNVAGETTIQVALQKGWRG